MGEGFGCAVRSALFRTRRRLGRGSVARLALLAACALVGLAIVTNKSCFAGFGFASFASNPRPPTSERSRSPQAARRAGFAPDWWDDLVSEEIGDEDEDSAGNLKEELLALLGEGEAQNVVRIDQILAQLERPGDHDPTDESDTTLDISMAEKVLWFMARCQQTPRALNRMEVWLQEKGLSKGLATRLYNSILLGIAQTTRKEEPLRHKLAGTAILVFSAMRGNAVEFNSDTLALLCRAKMQSTDKVQTVIKDVIAECSVGSPQVESGVVRESFSAAYLRAGDLEEAYRFFLKSQLASPDPPVLGGPNAKRFTRMHVSELLKGLALAGMVLEMRWILQRIYEQGGRLWRVPGHASDTCAVMLAGRAVGRTLATVWMEPGRGYLKRRELWASRDKVKVTCAEQHNWKHEEVNRCGVQEWAPFYPPNTKVERAWLAPIASESAGGALGLLGAWAGENLPAMAARHQLTLKEEDSVEPDDPEAVPNNQDADDLQYALSPFYNGETPLAGWCTKEHSWRVQHADLLQKEELRQFEEGPAGEELERQCKEALTNDGSAVSELELALDISELIRNLGGCLSEADVHTLHQAAYSVSDPSLAEKVLRSHAAEALRPRTSLAQESVAIPTYKEVLVQGGWEAESVDDFLAGRRAVPSRDPTHELGALATNKVDPLLELVGRNPDERRACLRRLLEKVGDRKKADGVVGLPQPQSTEIQEEKEEDLQFDFLGESDTEAVRSYMDKMDEPPLSDEPLDGRATEPEDEWYDLEVLESRARRDGDTRTPQS